jgi:hypothetical protein
VTWKVVVGVILVKVGVLQFPFLLRQSLDDGLFLIV